MYGPIITNFPYATVLQKEIKIENNIKEKYVKKFLYIDVCMFNIETR